MTTTVDALLLRTWAAHSLFTPRRMTPPAVPDDAWRFFLTMECCALPLQKLHRNLAPAVNDAAQLESLRVSSARTHVARLSEIAGDHSLKIVLLKGAVAVMAGVPIHLEDVDVLCSAEDAHVLASLLEGSWEIGVFVTHPGRTDIRIEVHACADASLLDAAVPSVDAPGLWQLAAPDHLWYVLHHSVSDHPDRIARLRDLLLIHHAMTACTPDEVTAIAARAHRAVERASLLATLEFLRHRDFRALAGVERYVRTRYFLLARFRALGRARSGQTILTYAAWLTASPWSRSIRRMFTPPMWTSGFRILRLVATRSPRLDRAIRLATRPVILAIATSRVLMAVIEKKIYLSAQRRTSHERAAVVPQP